MISLDSNSKLTNLGQEQSVITTLRHHMLHTQVEAKSKIALQTVLEDKTLEVKWKKENVFQLLVSLRLGKTSLNQ